MANYKVIQDIEAEDKILGPLSIRQLLYAIVALGGGFVGYKLMAINTLLFLPFLPIVVLFGFLAAPLMKDQPSEVWLLAKIRFMLKPRRRIWNQDGVNDLVTITAPKLLDKQLVNDLSQSEVHSRLHALAQTIDSRGWAVKNSAFNLYSQPSYVLNTPVSERLIDPATIPQEVPVITTTGIEDMLDEHTSQTAVHFSQMIEASEVAHKRDLLARMQQTADASAAAAANRTATPEPTDYWFLAEPTQAPTPRPVGPNSDAATFQGGPIITPGQNTTGFTSTATATPAEIELLRKAYEQQHRSDTLPNNHLKTIQPTSAQPNGKPVQPSNPQAGGRAAPPGGGNVPQSSTPTPDPDIIRLANSDDLNIATIQRQANRKRPPAKPGSGEIVVSLH